MPILIGRTIQLVVTQGVTPFRNEFFKAQERYKALKEGTMVKDLNSIEQDRYNMFLDIHISPITKRVCNLRVPELKYHPTGIGTNIEVHCVMCECVWDISDYGSW